MLHSLFPSLIHQSRLFNKGSGFIRELLVETQQIQKADAQGRLWSEKNYPGGFTSYGSLDKLHLMSSTFEKLQKKIDAAVAEYVRALELDIRPRDLKMSTCWVNIMAPQVTHTMHIHPLSVISGTFYLAVPIGAPGLKFEDPRMVNFMASPPRKKKVSVANSRFFEVIPREGEVILFESWMRHEVPPNRAKKNRISVSFNYDWC